MVKYIKLYSLFKGFLKTLNIQELNSFEKKFINLINENFDEIVVIGTYKGQRAKLIANIIKEKGKDLSDLVDLTEQASDKNSFPIKKIISLEVEKFRGFNQKEIFSFDKRYTLVYGPNGSGKSSFCDALEYVLLGYIDESIAKRIDVEKYIKNLVVKTSRKPLVKAINHDDKQIEIEQNPEIYNFCFIEKNRITNFARISANTPSDQRNIISTLFGLEEFSKFSSNFTDSIEEYIDVKGVKGGELETKKSKIVEAETLLKNANEQLEKIEKEKEKIVSSFQNYSNFNDLNVYINGEENKETEGQKKDVKNIGRIKIIENELTESAPEKFFIKKYDDLEASFSILETEITIYKNHKIKYDSQKDNVNYKNLYEAVIGLKEISKSQCPACQTPIVNTSVNPFTHAEEEIISLKELVELEQKIEVSWNNVTIKLKALDDDVRKIEISSLKFETPLSINIIDLKNSEIKNREADLNKVSESIKLARENKSIFDVIYQKGAEYNKKIDNIDQYKELISKEKGELEKVAEEIKNIITRETLYKDQIKNSNEIIKKFNEENSDLIKQVIDEKELILLNKEYLDAYNSIIPKLKLYSEKLPLKLVENLNDTAKDFYNIINKNDKKFELLASLELPINPESGIKVRFQNNESESFDALHILSEGHIRCLGLSILLAKNVADNKTVVIFDDVVNAIDDDHREGIRELLFKDSRIKDKQIILTSHAEEFIKDLDNQFKTKEYSELVKRITFLRPSDVRSILVDRGNSTFNYLEEASKDFEGEKKRDCLSKCRQALENITNTLWKRLGNVYIEGITIKLRQPKGAPDLMNVVQGLHKYLIDKDFPEKLQYSKTVEIFAYLQGLQSTHHNIWEYLNKGTHDESDRKEFDKAVVEIILTKVKDLNDITK